jgi:ABC-type amino acid transport system permease subunit
MPPWFGALGIIGLFVGSGVAISQFSASKNLGWIVAVIVGWVIGLPLINALVFRRFGGRAWPPWRGDG